jgi:hypothetical protein
MSVREEPERAADGPNAIVGGLHSGVAPTTLGGSPRKNRAYVGEVSSFGLTSARDADQRFVAGHVEVFVRIGGTLRRRGAR